jgi:hypothetical protein
MQKRDRLEAHYLMELHDSALPLQTPAYLNLAALSQSAVGKVQSD